MECPDVDDYYRARVLSCDGKTVQATYVDYGDAHPVSTEKVFPLPDSLEAFPSLATRCSISCPKWPLEMEKLVTMTTTEGLRLLDSPAPNGQNIGKEMFAGLDAVPNVCIISKNPV